MLKTQLTRVERSMAMKMPEEPDGMEDLISI
jgi:hypothetical protein